MKRILSAVAFVFAVAMAFTVAASAAPAPKATGDYGYNFAGVQRHVSFSAIQSTTDTCGTLWNVTGVKSFDFTLSNDPTTHRVHDASLAQTGQAITGSGGYPQGGPYQYGWHIQSGSVIGNTINLTVAYDYSTDAIGDVMNMTGTIAPDGSISGTWNDNYAGGYRTGNFTASGATQTATYCGKGTFSYTDENGAWYFGVVKGVSVSSTSAWYAVQILASNLGYEQNNQWLSVKVTDNGEPGINRDVTGGDITDQATALSDVVNHVTPSTSAIVNQGNIQVH